MLAAPYPPRTANVHNIRLLISYVELSCLQSDMRELRRRPGTVSMHKAATGHCNQGGAQGDVHRKLRLPGTYCNSSAKQPFLCQLKTCVEEQDTTAAREMPGQHTLLVRYDTHCRGLVPVTLHSLRTKHRLYAHSQGCAVVSNIREPQYRSIQACTGAARHRDGCGGTAVGPPLLPWPVCGGHHATTRGIPRLQQCNCNCYHLPVHHSLLTIEVNTRIQYSGHDHDVLGQVCHFCFAGRRFAGEH